MSNCVQSKTRILLSADHVDYLKLKSIRDTDGNKIEYDLNGKGFVLSMGQTSHREWAHFLWDHVQPFIKSKGLSAKFTCTDESDGFAQEFIGTVRFQDPGLRRPGNPDTVGWPELWAKIWDY